MGSRLALIGVMVGIGFAVFAVASAARPRLDPQLAVRAIAAYQDRAWLAAANRTPEHSFVSCEPRGPCFLESYVPDNLSRVRKLVLCRNPKIADDSCLKLSIPEGYRLVRVSPSRR